ncbi:SURF1 family protein [Aeromicrobium phragmitis]|uniref:SURF1-like protein n=1 Tax=Aeromicrobium phragmitis TaxID=2478914 RepID=A0A3L8PHT9_9ACTN|nr:SURF1 family protein [Aeromicrobium phragmitis]RLV54704.1 SURF1 family protein [Aeromicrobium phragmitis]
MGFLLSRRWLGFGAFVVALSVTCVFLGMWQHDRHEQRQDRNARIEAHAAANPVPVEDVAPPDEGWEPGAEWTRVTATGHYDPEHEIVLKFQQRGSSPGVDIVTPLILESGDAVLVDRGWLSARNTAEKPEDIPPAPTGTVEVTGWLRADSTAEGQAVTPENGQVRAIHSEAVAATLPYDLLEGYVALREQVPASEGLIPAEPPDLGMGVNLFYSWQWYFFAGLAIFGFVWFLRAELKERREKALTPS